MRNPYQTCFGTKGKKKNSFLSLLLDINCLYVQFRQAVDGILLQLVYGAGIFLDVLQSAMTKDAGDSLDVGAIADSRWDYQNHSEFFRSVSGKSLDLA